MSKQAHDTAFADIGWNFDRPLANGKPWCTRYVAYLGDAMLVVYEGNEWLVYLGVQDEQPWPTPHANGQEPTQEDAKRRAFRVYCALTHPIEQAMSRVATPAVECTLCGYALCMCDQQ